MAERIHREKKHRVLVNWIRGGGQRLKLAPLCSRSIFRSYDPLCDIAHLIECVAMFYFAKRLSAPPLRRDFDPEMTLKTDL